MFLVCMKIKVLRHLALQSWSGLGSYPALVSVLDPVGLKQSRQMGHTLYFVCPRGVNFTETQYHCLRRRKMAKLRKG